MGYLPIEKLIVAIEESELIVVAVDVSVYCCWWSSRQLRLFTRELPPLPPHIEALVELFGSVEKKLSGSPPAAQ